MTDTAQPPKGYPVVTRTALAELTGLLQNDRLTSSDKTLCLYPSGDTTGQLDWETIQNAIKLAEDGTFLDGSTFYTDNIKDARNRLTIRIMSGNWYLNQPVVIKKVLTLIGDGPFVTIFRQVTPGLDCFIIQPDTEQIWGMTFKGIGFDGFNYTSSGVKCICTSPFVITNSTFADLLFRYMLNGFEAVSPAGNAFYQNDLKNFKVSGFRGVGVSLSGGCGYNDLQNIEVSGPWEDTYSSAKSGYALYISSIHTSLRQIMTEGCAYLDMPWGQVENYTLEMAGNRGRSDVPVGQQYGQTRMTSNVAINCVANRMTLKNIKIVNVLPASGDYPDGIVTGIILNGSSTTAEGIFQDGPRGCQYPLRIGLGGSVSNFYVANNAGYPFYHLEDYTAPSNFQNWRFYGCNDEAQGVGHGVVRIEDGGWMTATLPTASSIYRGRKLTLLAAAGAADSVKTCVKSAAETYSWV